MSIEQQLLTDKYRLVDVKEVHSYATSRYRAVEMREEDIEVFEYFPTSICRRTEDGRVVPILEGGEQEALFKEGLSDFMAHGRKLVDFRHPAVVEVIDAFEKNGTGYLVSRARTGAPWSEVLTPLGDKLPVGPALKIILPIIEALDQAHQKGIFHLGLSPDTIFLDNDGEAFIKPVTEAEVALSRRLNASDSVAVDGFSAPEIYADDQPLGAWSDIYSVGACLYRLLIGGDLPEAPLRQLGDVVPDYIEMDPNLRPELKYVLKRALALDPTERPKSIGLLKRAIEAVSENRRVTKPDDRTNIPEEDLFLEHPPEPINWFKPMLIAAILAGLTWAGVFWTSSQSFHSASVNEVSQTPMDEGIRAVNNITPEPKEEQAPPEIEETPSVAPVEESPAEPETTVEEPQLQAPVATVNLGYEEARARAEQLYAQEQWLDAKPYYERAQELRPDEQVLSRRLASIEALTDPVKGAAAADWLINRGLDEIASGDLPKARRTFARASLLDPSRSDAIEKIRDIDRMLRESQNE